MKEFRKFGLLEPSVCPERLAVNLSRLYLELCILYAYRSHFEWQWRRFLTFCQAQDFHDVLLRSFAGCFLYSKTQLIFERLLRWDIASQLQVGIKSIQLKLINKIFHGNDYTSRTPHPHKDNMENSHNICSDFAGNLTLSNTRIITMTSIRLAVLSVLSY